VIKDTNYPVYCQGSKDLQPRFIYLRGKDESLPEAVNSALEYLRLTGRSSFKEYYLLQILSSEIGKDLANLYALMPQAEKLNDELEIHRKALAEEGIFADELEQALVTMLSYDLPKGTKNIFFYCQRGIATRRIRNQSANQLPIIIYLGNNYFYLHNRYCSHCVNKMKVNEKVELCKFSCYPENSHSSYIFEPSPVTHTRDKA